MFFNSKFLALVTSFAVTAILAFLMFVFPEVQRDPVLLLKLTLILSFVASLATFRFFVFKELAKIPRLLNHIKRKDYKFDFKLKPSKNNPLAIIKNEISEFAATKQKEINDLKKLESFRREFLADVSHELKTPIFAAQGFVHTLLDGAIDDLDVRDRFLKKAATSLDGLNILVEDLITISQLESGDIKMNFTSFDVHKLTEDIYDQLEDTAHKRGIKLKFNKSSVKSAYVYADKHRINQVLTNLIINAVKYGNEKGTVKTAIIIENNDVYISVKDDGPGIAQQHLNRIFERFYRVEKSRSREKGGTGLGLAIVKHILEAHDSKIYVSSKVGGGTIFSFKLKRGKVINEEG